MVTYEQEIKKLEMKDRKLQGYSSGCSASEAFYLLNKTEKLNAAELTALNDLERELNGGN